MRLFVSSGLRAIRSDEPSVLISLILCGGCKDGRVETREPVFRCRRP